MKMKAVVTIAPKHSVLKEVDVPEMTDYSVMIKIKYCGVCHSEHYEWAHHGGTFGHEPMGTIVEVGKEVTGYAVGDRVSGLWGSTLPGAGALCEYMVADVRDSTIIKLPDHIRDEDLVVEPLSCMFSAVSKVHCSMPGTKVAVVGCGYMGCGAITLLKKRGCYVVAVDIRETSRIDALYYGADEVYTPEEALEKYIYSGPLANTMDAGFEAVMEWGETNDSIATAVKLTKVGGQLCLAAYHAGERRLVDLQELGAKAVEVLNTHPRQKELSIKGAINSVEMLARGDWNYKDIPTMVYPRNQFDRAMEEMATKYGRFMKSLINMEMEDGEPYMAK